VTVPLIAQTRIAVVDYALPSEQQTWELTTDLAEIAKANRGGRVEVERRIGSSQYWAFSEPDGGTTSLV
tara:strand:+ start:762 stop:968 length:207 start_codon:yes stop_codon:yes gene_type:complete